MARFHIDLRLDAPAPGERRLADALSEASQVARAFIGSFA
jgi:hypothetical protein